VVNTPFLGHNFLDHQIKEKDLARIAMLCLHFLGVRGIVVGEGTMQQAGRSRVPFPMRLLDFFILPNPSSRTMALGSAQPLTEINTRNLPGGKGRPAGA
jgi:hypothetical protein